MSLGLIIVVACEQETEPQLRENEYSLHRVGFTNVSGVVTFTEQESGAILVSINLENTQEGQPFPAHLHFGTISETGELAFRLNDVDGATGSSSTLLDNVELSNGETLTFDMLDTMNGSVKIHLNDSFFKNIAIASGNIGKNENYDLNGIAVCTGH